MNKQVRYALISALLVMVGMAAGFGLRQSTPAEKRKELKSGFEKIQEAIWYIEQNYVDTVNTQHIVDAAIKGMLESLDPHSFYINSKDMAAMEEQMKGSFQGIGIEFNILEDTIYVVAPLSGGPSEKAGILAGDRIISVDGENVAGTGIANSDVMKLLRGEKGSEVVVGILRHGNSSVVDYKLERDDIPIFSIDYAYMIRPETGYIKVSRFASTTHKEFVKALKDLKKQGMKKLVLDLRGNPGGFMEMAQRIADEFLEDDKLVVYTEGRIHGRGSEYHATSKLSQFEDGPLVVLLDYGSASASEIVAGAVQDWDRGLIAGVRSFGKGLVQTQKEFDDGSAMRLVISKYYIPSGRCIQKPYDKSSKEYDNEILERFESGEIYDSTKIDLPDSLKFKTKGGRTVYGGGGIMPDVFIARDTSEYSAYLSRLISADLFREFSFFYGDKHTEILQRMPEAEDFNRKYRVTQQVLDDFLALAESKSVPFNEAGFNTSKRVIKIYIKAFLGRKLYQDDGFFPTYHKADNVLERAIELLPEAGLLEQTGRFAVRAQDK